MIYGIIGKENYYFKLLRFFIICYIVVGSWYIDILLFFERGSIYLFNEEW